MHNLNENCKACGENVIIRNVRNYNPSVNVKGILIPDNYMVNSRIGKAKIISVGADVPKYINVGDIIAYDLHAIIREKKEGQTGTATPGEYLILHYDSILYRDLDPSLHEE